MTINLENYTRTDNPDGSVTFTPIKVGKRFIPKMEEEYFSVPSFGGIEDCTWKVNDYDKGRLAMGNIYRTREEAEKARDKQLALVRIQHYIADNDLGKEFVSGERNYSIAYDHRKKVFDWFNWDSHDQYNPISYLKSVEACTQVIENCKEDLLIVWGRK